MNVCFHPVMTFYITIIEITGKSRPFITKWLHHGQLRLYHCSCDYITAIYHCMSASLPLRLHPGQLQSDYITAIYHYICSMVITDFNTAHFSLNNSHLWLLHHYYYFLTLGLSQLTSTADCVFQHCCYHDYVFLSSQHVHWSCIVTFLQSHYPCQLLLFQS